VEAHGALGIRRMAETAELRAAWELSCPESVFVKPAFHISKKVLGDMQTRLIL